MGHARGQTRAFDAPPRVFWPVVAWGQRALGFATATPAGRPPLPAPPLGGSVGPPTSKPQRLPGTPASPERGGCKGERWRRLWGGLEPRGVSHRIKRLLLFFVSERATGCCPFCELNVLAPPHSAFAPPPPQRPPPAGRVLPPTVSGSHAPEGLGQWGGCQQATTHERPGGLDRGGRHRAWEPGSRQACRPVGPRACTALGPLSPSSAAVSPPPPPRPHPPPPGFPPPSRPPPAASTALGPSALSRVRLCGGHPRAL